MFSGEGRRDFTKKNQGGNLRITPFGPLRCFEISKPSLKISIVCIIRQIHGPWSDVLVLLKDQIFPTFAITSLSLFMDIIQGTALMSTPTYSPEIYLHVRFQYFINQCFPLIP